MVPITLRRTKLVLDGKSKDGVKESIWAAWGTNLVDSSNQLSVPFQGSPRLLSPQFRGHPEPINVFFMGTGMWPDGAAAPTNGR